MPASGVRGIRRRIPERHNRAGMRRVETSLGRIPIWRNLRPIAAATNKTRWIVERDQGVSGTARRWRVTGTNEPTVIERAPAKARSETEPMEGRMHLTRRSGVTKTETTARATRIALSTKSDIGSQEVYGPPTLDCGGFVMGGGT
jgi:hypothetical protein